MTTPKLVGIVNITGDSFSDGGKFLEAGAAIAQAKHLIAEGTDVVELSGASSNPRSARISATEQIARMTPVLDALEAPLSIDATDIDVQRWALSKDVAYLNDIKGFPDASLYPELTKSNAKLVVMHAMMDGDKASRAAHTTQQVFDSIYSFFTTRLQQLEAAGVSRERLIIDPGMGFFLSSDPAPSFAVLSRIKELKERFGLPLMVSVSRKSFLRGGAAPDSPQTAARTLEVELDAVKNGADYIRTHDVRQLKTALS